MVSVFTVTATFVAGIGSFLNPCTVPLLPAYLSYAGGMASADLAGVAAGGRGRGRLVMGTCLFVLGFTTVFVLAGVGAGGLGRAVQRAERPVEIAGGAGLVVLGLALAGLIRARVLSRGGRASPPRWALRGGTWGAFPLGAVFAIGWTPCVGPYLASALTLAAVSGHATSGALLLAVYAIGLGVPFLAASLLWASMPGLGRRAARIAPAATTVGGLVMAGLGALLLSGEYHRLTSVFAQLSTPR